MLICHIVMSFSHMFSFTPPDSVTFRWSYYGSGNRTKLLNIDSLPSVKSEDARPFVA